MKTSIIAATAFIFVGLLDGFAGSDLSPDASRWCDWINSNVGTSTNFYANNGTFKVAAGGDGSFGKGVGEVTYTSNNKAPVPEHQFGNAIWGSGGNTALFDPGALAGKAGIELLVNVDPSSTSDKICIKFTTSTPGEVYSQTVTIERGSIQCVQFPFSNFKSSKNPGTSLTDFSALDGKIQITDGWNGYPQPAQVTWTCKFSNIYTYGAAADAGTGTAAPGSPPAH